MSPSNSQPEQIQPDVTSIVVETTEDPNFAFDDWNSPNAAISIHDRVLVSLLSISYAQAFTDTQIKDYITSLSPEVKSALSERAENILRSYREEVVASSLEENSQTLWINATKFGIRSNLDDFVTTQSSSLRELKDSFQHLDSFVRDRTSLKSQALLAFGVALALSVFVGALKIAVTTADDIWPTTQKLPASASLTQTQQR